MNNGISSITTNLKNELTILQSMARIRIFMKDSPTQKNDKALLNKFSPVNYLEQNPELTEILNIKISNRHLINKDNHKVMSFKDLLNKIKKVAIIK